MKVSTRKIMSDAGYQGAAQYEKTKEIEARVRRRQLAQKKNDKASEVTEPAIEEPEEEEELDFSVENVPIAPVAEQQERTNDIWYKEIKILVLPGYPDSAVYKRLQENRIAISLIGTDCYCVWVKNPKARILVAEAMNAMGGQSVHEKNGFLTKKTAYPLTSGDAIEKRLRGFRKDLEKKIQKGAS